MAVLITACAGGSVTSPDAGTDGGLSGFDDHTRSGLTSREDYAAFLPQGAGLETVKFVISPFGEASTKATFLDGRFYTLHDEWYWYRLMNGQPFVGDPETAPVRGFRFDTVQLIHDWARAQTTALPLDLQFTSDDRLYSARFYQLALDESPRRFGLGAIIHVPASGATTEKWVFELEYSDHVTHEELVTYFQTLERSLPADIASALRWVVRSPDQELLAVRMETESLQYGDRITRYKELSTPGAKEVYSEGITAGRIRVVHAGEPLEGGSSSDILVLESVPDYLPPCSGLVTGVPQTPLAHVAVLARNRGIPNVYLGGASFDPLIDQLGRVNAPAILRGVAPGVVDLVPITEDEYRNYVATLAKSPVAVEQISLANVQPTYLLEDLDPADSDTWRPILGGKSTGYLAILSAAGVTHPENPVGISIKPYVEHTQPMRARFEQMLRHPEFQGEPRARYLVLQGESDYRAKFRSPSDIRYIDDFLRRFPQGTVLGDLVKADGVQGLIRSTPIASATLAAITTTLQAQYGSYAISQGLRFRSSSNAEDIEGFNGAGLYDSNTGYLEAASLPDPALQTHSVEWALKKTWASYWTFEGFEERRLELVDHLSGAMASTVHARFDDDKETSNGVMVLTILAPAPLEGPRMGRAERIVMEVNAQYGALSVTNPEPGNPQLPEVTRVFLDVGNDTPRIVRVRPSTLSRDGQFVLDDPKVLSIFAQSRAVADGWLTRIRRDAPRPEQAPRVLTLDYEYREVAAGWPALRSGEVRPPRLVVKQARSLDPGLRTSTAQLRSLLLPKDVLVRSRRVTKTTCRSDALDVVVVDAFTDPLSAPDLGYDTFPFVGSVSLVPRRDIPTLGLVAGSTVTFSHLDFEARHPSGLSVDITGARRTELERIELSDAGHYRLVRGANEQIGDAVCTPLVLRATPKEFLFELLATKQR
mgnify:CR=1 FL=1